MLAEVKSNAGSREGDVREVGKSVDGNGVSKNNSSNTKPNIISIDSNIKSPFLKLKLK